MDLMNSNDTTRNELNKGQVEYIRWMGMHDDILRQKARVNWFEEGDANTKYFHSTIRGRRRRLQILKIKDHRGQWIEGDANIGKDNESLTAIPDTKEIRYVVFNMDPDSAAGPDGYNGKFFQSFWDIIKEDITDFVQAVFNGRRLTKFFSHTCLVLIPKVDSPNSFSDLRPISLSNFTAKIISKILSRRLNPILGKLISENQSGFVKGRLITENILLSQEIAQGVNKKNRGGNVIIKLDMAKAYDRISWTFLIAVMRKFGFYENWIDMIWGLLQDICMDSRGPMINHLAYADDIVIFCGGNNMTLKLIKKVIDMYGKASGQKVNNDKSFFITAPHTCAARINRIRNATGYMDKSFPFTYLGCPIYFGRKTSNLFDGMLSKVVKKLNGWQANMMSSGGRMILIKHVLQSLPTYILSAMNPPKGITKLMEKHFANFFWGTNEGKNKYHWSSWNNLCLPKEEGGAGVKKMEDIIDTLNIKRWWRFRTHPSLWANLLKNKYCKRAHPVNKKSNPSDSHIWRNMLKIRHKAEENIRCEIQKGNCSFWWDNWTGKGALANILQGSGRFSKVQVKDFIINGEWTIVKLNDVLPVHIMDSVAQLDIGDPNEDDFPVEIVQHVFNSSKAAIFIWNNIGNAFGIKHQQKPIIATFKRWWETTANNKVHNQMLQIAPTTICWELWKQRNTCKYEKQKKFQLNSMRHQITWTLKTAISNMVPGEYTQMEWPLLCDKVERLRPYQKWIQVTWESPLAGTIKVNTDGSFYKESGKAGIGGVVRNSQGDLIAAFSIHISCDDHTIVEAKAAEFGGKWCSQNGYTNFSIELDSKIIVNMLTDENPNDMQIKKVIDRASLIIKQTRATVRHCFREGNQVADCLAKLATTTNQRRLYHSLQELPSNAKGLFLLDKWQLPSIRTKYEKSNFFVS
uniref:Uncharacterized protein n=1 Tax=Nicotiana tabacum TaxID=4097 RepID=A0A1S3XAM8_TOBAC|nr:PREDICTED: uncharacterized protein LOC107762942 [Nicotiana tabacum]